MKQLIGSRSRVLVLAILFVLAAIIIGILTIFPRQPAEAQTDRPQPLPEPVKLIFIHHSTGENWLKDEDGGLGLALAENNYFVSDTNYGWGPNAVGDRTDILNWPEWFVGPDTPTYMDALYNESSTHSAYTRLFDDPGGENQIILFKSCFPNSALDGNPDDPAQQTDYLTVGGAKYIYNQLLTYFATRPDKLFVVITAPPLSDPYYADNARAFNNWLMQDWLQENNYPYANVAVYDFYNILTGRDNHHRMVDGQIEYINNEGKNTLAYATSSGDDHPNHKGNQKATEEFVPVLNYFYQRWVDAGPVEIPLELPAENTEAAPEEDTVQEEPDVEAGLLDDFDGETPADTQGWEANWDASTPTTITCGPADVQSLSGAQSLQIDYAIAVDSWGTCTLFYSTPQDLSTANGLRFAYRTAQAGGAFDVDLYSGTADAFKTYSFTIQAEAAGVDGWTEVTVPWHNFLRVAWEESAGAPFDDQAQVSGIGFGLTGSGSLWIDDLQLITDELPAGSETETSTAVDVQEPTEEAVAVEDEPPVDQDESDGDTGSICPFSMVPLAGLIITAGISIRRKKLR